MDDKGWRQMGFYLAAVGLQSLYPGLGNWVAKAGRVMRLTMDVPATSMDGGLS